MNEKTAKYIEQNKDRFMQELFEFLKIPSVSANAKYKDDVLRCANWLAGHLEKMGFKSQVIKTKGHPIVLSEAKGKSNKRLTIYGHYDVQPVDPVTQWKSPPFEPEIRDGFIYARGATDDKGQLFAHVKAIESLIKSEGGLGCNISFLVEGEEECGGNSLEEFIIKEKNRLATDAIIISDTSMYDEKTPAITYGLRGIAAFEIKVRTAASDLHSGVFGGAVGNAAAVLAYIISQTIGMDGRINVPGLYDDIRPLKDWEKKNLARLSFDEKKLTAETGIKKVFGESAYPILQRMWMRPTLEFNGIFGGYMEMGMKTIIPSTAGAKISIRLVPDQDPHKVVDCVIRHIKSVCPDFADVEIVGNISAAEPVIFDVEEPAIKAGCDALKAGFGAEPVFIRSGGSIPIVNTFWKELRKPVVLMGFGLDSDGAHSINEKFNVNNFFNGIRASTQLISSF